jgi:membrane protein implicated in regulation of membrane protease activity
MTTPLLIALSFGISFLLIEIVTSTFYGLSLSIASFVVAVWVYFSWALTLSLLHAVIFLILSVILSYFLPKFLTPEGKNLPQWLDKYIGETRKLKKSGDEYRVTLDGVEYVVEGDALASGKTFRIEGRKGMIFSGSITD